MQRDLTKDFVNYVEMYLSKRIFINNPIKDNFSVYRENKK